MFVVYIRRLQEIYEKYKPQIIVNLIAQAGLQFFNVYGPAGRSDMAYLGFKPSMNLRAGLWKFTEWYKEFYV